MRTLRSIWKSVSTDNGLLMISALGIVILHALTNSQYGFHRDELATIDDARYLAWGYVAYPPVTPFIARISLTLFGPSLVALRFFSSSAVAIGMIVTGLMVREMGGKRWAQLVAAWAAATAPVALATGTMFQYVAFDYLWWILTAYFVIRVLKSDDPRWWMAAGCTAGLGLMTKYTMAFFIAGIVGGMILTEARRYFLNKWFWIGVAICAAIALPNFIWQAQHNYISLEFLRFIHVRDVRMGRANNFLLGQLHVSSNVVTVPLWLAGLYYMFFVPAGKRFRAIAWMFVITLAIFVFAKGRDYYFTPAFPMVLAAGAVRCEQWVSTLSPLRARIVRRTIRNSWAISFVIVAAIVLPMAPAGSRWFKVADALNGNFNEEFGWHEMTDAVVRTRTSLRNETVPIGVLAGDAGYAGALNLYGRPLGLPEAISGSNSHWLRGYGDPPPEIVITTGFKRKNLDGLFESCELAAQIKLPYGVTNSSIEDRTDVFVCRHPRQPWNVVWKNFRWFG